MLSRRLTTQPEQTGNPIVRLSRNARIGIVGLLVTVAALYFILTQINLTLFGEALLTARYEYVLPCVLLLLLGLITRALRWQVLLDGALPFMRAFSIMNVAYLVNGVLPLRMGEVARVYLATRVRKPVPIPQTAGTIIVERLLDLLAVVMLVLLALAAGPVPSELRAAAGVAAIMVLLGFSVLVLMAANRTLAQRVLMLVMRLLPFLQRWHLETWLDQFLEGLQPLARPRSFAAALGWTAISWALSVMAGYILMYAFFDVASWSATALYIAAAAFAIALPAVPGNVGTYEASILLALTAMGYEYSATTLAFAVMVHGVNVFVHVSTGVMGFVQEGISLNQLSQGVRQMRSEGASQGAS